MRILKVSMVAVAVGEVSFLSLRGDQGKTQKTSATVAVRDLNTVEQELLNLIHGQPVPVKGSRALCQPQAKPPTEETSRKLWLWGDTGCKLIFKPRPDSLVGPLTEGASKELQESPQLRGRLDGLLDELIEIATPGNLPAKRQLLLHSTAWEIVFGIQQVLDDHREWQRSVGPTVLRGLKLLRTTRFSSAKLGELPSTLGGLPESAGVERIGPTVAGLIWHDPGFPEVIPASDLHAEVLLGRFSARIFVTTRDPEERERLRRFVTNPATSYRELNKLPQRFAGVEGILVLYFNVFDEQGKIRPTGVVAAWQSYYFTGKTSFDLPFAEAEQRISFLVVEALRQWTGDEPLRYVETDQARMARRTFLDVKPKISDLPVTTLRAHCLACHLNVVGTFNTHVPRPVEFTPPLVRSSDEALSWFYEGFERELGRWEQEYGLSSPGAAEQQPSEKDAELAPVGDDDDGPG